MAIVGYLEGMDPLVLTRLSPRGCGYLPDRMLCATLLISNVMVCTSKRGAWALGAVQRTALEGALSWPS